MSTPVSPPAPAPVTGPVDPAHDLDAAHRAHLAATTPRATGTRIGDLEFSGQLNFLVTIGYLTKDQAAALFAWFKANGMMQLPALPDPTGAPSPSMYETLSTAIHFGTPAGVLHAEHGILDGIGDFFSGLLGGVTDLIDTTLGGVTAVLQAGTALVQAGSQLVGQLHELVAA
jgi:hypothetical protein